MTAARTTDPFAFRGSRSRLVTSARSAAATLLLVACSAQVIVVDTDDDGSTGSSGGHDVGAGGGGSASFDVSTSTGSCGSSGRVCHELHGDCTTCVVDCANDGPCGPCTELYEAAGANPDAQEMMACFLAASCGSAPDWKRCTDACAAKHPAGLQLIMEYYVCIECAQCPMCQDVGWTKYYGCP